MSLRFIFESSPSHPPPGIPSHMTDVYLYSVLNIPIRVTSWLLLQSVPLLNSSQGSNIFPDIYLQYSSLQLVNSPSGLVD